MVSEVEIEPRPVRSVAQPSEAEREAAAQLLCDAVGGGRLTLDEFGERVAAVWAAERSDEIERVTAGLVDRPVVGARTVSTIVAFLGDQRLGGRWRLPPRLRAFGVLGDIHLDLRSVVCAEETVEIRACTLLGDIDIQVLDGVEVELTGFDLFGDRELRLAPAPRLKGTPEIRVRVYTLLGDVSVRSTSAGKGVAGWRRWLLGQQSPPVSGPPPVPPQPSRRQARRDKVADN